MAALAWGRKVSPEFASRVVQIAKRLSSGTAIVDPNWLMSCMAFETGERFTPTVKNPGSSATGLIQFMRATAIALGTTTAALARMTAVQQLDYVEKYFLPYRGRIRSLSDCYMVILFPRAVGKPESYKLFVQGDGNYFANKGLDVDHDGSVTKAEAAAKVAQKLRRGLTAEFIGQDDDAVDEDDMSGQLVDETPPAAELDDETPPPGSYSPVVEALQNQLKALGYAPGMIDGKWGGSTKGAAAAFKTDRHLDGEAVLNKQLLDGVSSAVAEGWRRPVAAARSGASETTIANNAEELKPVVQARKTTFGAMILSALGTIGAGIMSVFKDASDWVTGLQSTFSHVPGYVWLGMTGAVAFVLWWQVGNGAESIKAKFRSGERQ